MNLNFPLILLERHFFSFLKDCWCRWMLREDKKEWNCILRSWRSECVVYILIRIWHFIVDLVTLWSFFGPLMHIIIIIIKCSNMSSKIIGLFSIVALYIIPYHHIIIVPSPPPCQCKCQPERIKKRAGEQEIKSHHTHTTLLCTWTENKYKGKHTKKLLHIRFIYLEQFIFRKERRKK